MFENSLWSMKASLTALLFLNPAGAAIISWAIQKHVSNHSLNILKNLIHFSPIFAFPVPPKIGTKIHHSKFAFLLSYILDCSRLRESIAIDPTAELASDSRINSKEHNGQSHCC